MMHILPDRRLHRCGCTTPLRSRGPAQDRKRPQPAGERRAPGLPVCADPGRREPARASVVHDHTSLSPAPGNDAVSRSTRTPERKSVVRPPGAPSKTPAKCRRSTFRSTGAVTESVDEKRKPRSFFPGQTCRAGPHRMQGEGVPPPAGEDRACARSQRSIR